MSIKLSTLDLQVIAVVNKHGPFRYDEYTGRFLLADKSALQYSDIQPLIAKGIFFRGELTDKGRQAVAEHKGGKSHTGNLLENGR